MAKRRQIEEVLEDNFDFETFQFNTLDDFKKYNAHARNAFRLAKMRDPKANPPFPVRVPDESYHKKVKVKFQRFDQPENVLKCRVRNEDIDWTGQLKPGCTYDLPQPVVKYLNNLSVPKFEEVQVNDGGATRTETKQTGEYARFSCQVIEFN